MKRHRKWLRRFVIAITLLIAILVVLYITVLPGIVHAKIIDGLQGLGIPDAAIEVRSVSARHLRLTDIALGKPRWLGVDELTARYSMTSLWNSRAKTIEIRNAEWRINVKDGAIDFGPILKPSSNESTNAPDLPFDSLRVQNSTIIFTIDGRIKRFPFAGTLTRRKIGQFDVDLQLQSSDAIEYSGTSIAGVTANLKMAVEMLPDETRFYVGEGNVIELDSLVITSEQGDLHGSPIRLAIEPSEHHSPLAQIRSGEEESSALFHGAIYTENPISLRSPAMEITADKFELSGNVKSSTSDGLAYEGTFAVNNGVFTLGSAQLELAKIDLNVPVSMNSSERAKDRSGDFTIGFVAWRDATFPPLSGKMQIIDRVIDAQTLWPVWKNALLTMSSSLEFSTSGLIGKLSAGIPAFELADSSSLGNLFPQLKETQIGGTYALNAQLGYGVSQAKPSVVFTAENASVHHPQWPATVQSASGSITIDSFDPLSTTADQRLEIRQARIGDFDITNAFFTYTLDSLESVVIQQTAWSMGDMGRFRAEPFQFNPAQPHIKTEIHCDDVGLKEWLPLLTDGRAKGEGKLTGSVMLDVQPNAQQKFSLGKGMLRSLDRTGWIQTADAEMIANLLEQSNPKFATDAQLRQAKDKIVAALRDFQYTDLQVEFIPEQDDLICRIETRGRGRTGLDPQEFGGLTINVHQFDERLNDALQFKAVLDRME